MVYSRDDGGDAKSSSRRSDKADRAAPSAPEGLGGIRSLIAVVESRKGILAGANALGAHQETLP
jgi:hypothetical protein